MLFAQAGGPFGGGKNNLPFGPEFLAAFLLIFFVVLAIFLVIWIFFLLTLYRCSSRIAPENRQMEPGLVWLNLIPCFQLIWIFFTVIRPADSLRAEFYSRQLRGGGDFGRGVGMAFAVLAVVGIPTGFIPFVGFAVGIAQLVCFIMYWVKIAGYSRQLLEDDYDRAEEEEEDWEEDDQAR
jgi:hypothetical protein